ncbi:MAG: DUF975 family protein [Eubacteriales bacterium]|nr:DUF975 family protein [Eubacteriales bacterium]
MNSKQLRQKAWNALKGRYWWTVLAALIAGLFGVISLGTSTGTITYKSDMDEQFTEKFTEVFDKLPDNGMLIIFSILAAIFIIALAMSIIGSAVRLGYCRFNMDLFTGVEKPTMNLLFSRLSIIWKALWKSILEGLLIALASIFLLVPGIIVGLMYSQSDYILAENPELKATEAMKRSREMMKGQKWNLFKLILSFFGWMILAGIVPAGELLLAPYIESATAAFYLDRTGRLSEKAEEAAADLGDLKAKA